MASRILIVDDEAHILHVLSLKLKNAGYEVITAPDGEEGFELASIELPDLVITDYQMPFMTGLELCHALADQSSTAKIPVLILTARGHALDDQDLKISNVKGILSKPFSPRAVLQLVEEFTGKSAESKQQAQKQS